MKNLNYGLFWLGLSLVLISCATDSISLAEENLEITRREVLSYDKASNTISFNNDESDGLAILKNVSFETGIIDLEIKGENVQGKSFVGIAFNVQNDSTYEAIYFRPFNFLAEEQIRREHSMQYLAHPKNTWFYLRENFEGQYEAEFPRQPNPDDWFKVQVKVDDSSVQVWDPESNTELLKVGRLDQSKSDKIALWMGFDSKGSFRNLKILD